MVRSNPVLLLTACALGTAIGCQTSEPTAERRDSPPVAAAPAARETSGGSYFIRYAPHPDPIPLNKMFELDIHVYQDAELTQRAENVAVEVDAAMPAHHHGLNLTPRVRQMDDGSFRASG
jgi:hypothetical protein